MNKILLETLIKIFALISSLYSSPFYENIRIFIRSFLNKEFSAEILNKYLILFKEYYTDFQADKNKSATKEDIIDYVRDVIRNLKDELHFEDRFLVLVRLLFFQKFLFKYPSKGLNERNLKLSELLEIIGESLNIDKHDFDNCKAFIFEKLYNLSNKNDLLIIGAGRFQNMDINFVERKNLKGQIYFLRITNADFLMFYYKGNHNLKIDNSVVFPENLYIFKLGSQIKAPNIEPIYYNQVVRMFNANHNPNINITVDKIDFSYENSENGIHNLSLSMNSGQMIGVIGKSGVGKSTLIKILNGSLKPDKGKIFINNYDLFNDKKKLEGLIGFIPQDDFLIEDLTVFENLYSSTKLCMGNLSDDEIVEKVNYLLKHLNLYSVRHLKVGSPLNQYISGGQRKRLNIALEIIREPWILLADEPTSGLSISDAEEIIKLLSEQAVKGKVVFCNIHQPSSDHFKMFDKILVLGGEGFPVYFGNPVDSIDYFNEKAHKFVRQADRCDHCGNVNHENIFNILNEEKVDSRGNYINERKVQVKEWHKRYTENIEEKLSEPEQNSLPKSHFNKPSAVKQFYIFFRRNLLSKISNNQYIVLSMLITPILAGILAFLSRSGIDLKTGNYIFSLNENIPAYLLMSVIVSLFVGLIISAEEIYRDRKVLKREQFLSLSKSAYLFSKLFLLFGISLIQSFLYVLIGNSILHIEGMFLYYWVVLFSASCFSNTLGLIISTIFNSVVVIYILVPLLIIPQILLCGVVVEYDDLNESVVSDHYVPIIGEGMVSRWAYEALVVTQFKENRFQQNYFSVDKNISNYRYDMLFVIPEIRSGLEDLMFQDVEQQKETIKFIKSNLIILDKNYNTDFAITYDQGFEKQEVVSKLMNKLELLKQHLADKVSKNTIRKDSITMSLLQSFGDIESFNSFKNKYHNKGLEDYVLKRNNFEPIVKKNNKLIRKIEPIYQEPLSNIGRAHFLSAIKKIGNKEISTFVFNVMVIWIITFMNYIILFTIFKRKNLIVK